MTKITFPFIPIICITFPLTLCTIHKFKTGYDVYTLKLDYTVLLLKSYTQESDS